MLLSLNTWYDFIELFEKRFFHDLIKLYAMKLEGLLNTFTEVFCFSNSSNHQIFIIKFYL